MELSFQSYGNEKKLIFRRNDKKMVFFLKNTCVLKNHYYNIYREKTKQYKVNYNE